MTILFILIPLSLVLLTIAVWGFFWMVKNNQFDDLDAEGWKMLSQDWDDFPNSDEDDEHDRTD